MSHAGIRRRRRWSKTWSPPRASIACFVADEKYGADFAGRRAGGRAAESGLHFICLGANIERQFEFVQSAWVMGTKFAGLTGESDPLLGHRLPDLGGSPTDGFSMPQADGPDRRLTGLPQFVTVRGGAYFFLPGIRALRYLATAR